MRNIPGLVVLLFALILSGCTAKLNSYKPFSEYIGQEVTLKRPCILAESIARDDGVAVYTYWEKDQPTELVYEGRTWAKPVKTVVNDYQQEQSLYPAADYKKRVFTLYDNDLLIKLYCNNYGGPYRVYPLTAGTKIFIENAYNFNGIDIISNRVEGIITIPGTSRQVQFNYNFSNGPSAHGTTNDYIARPPWKDETAPLEVFVGANGKMNGKRDPLKSLNSN